MLLSSAKKEQQIRLFNTNKVAQKPIHLNIMTFDSIPTSEFDPISDQINQHYNREYQSENRNNLLPNV